MVLSGESAHDLFVSRVGDPASARALARPYRDVATRLTQWIDRGDVQLVVNTPSGSGARVDGYEIRIAATARGIPCITTMTGASAAARAIGAMRLHGDEVRSLQELHAGQSREGATA